MQINKKDTDTNHTNAPNFAVELTRLVAQQSNNIARYTLSDGRTVWIRKAKPHNPAWRYALLGMITKPLHLGVLKPVPNLGGEKAIAVESTRLRTLYKAGIRVPELLAVQNNALMMGNLTGIALDVRIEQEAGEGHLDAWETGLSAIEDVHRRGQFLSQAFARNCIIDSDKISFLDFEDDPSEVLTLEECQSRDWLCYLHSTSLLLKKYGLLKQASVLWHDKLLEQSETVQKLVLQTVRPIRWIHCISHSFWGRDALRLAALTTLFILADSYF